MLCVNGLTENIIRVLYDIRHSLVLTIKSAAAKSRERTGNSAVPLRSIQPLSKFLIKARAVGANAVGVKAVGARTAGVGAAGGGGCVSNVVNVTASVDVDINSADVIAAVAVFAVVPAAPEVDAAIARAESVGVVGVGEGGACGDIGNAIAVTVATIGVVRLVGVDFSGLLLWASGKLLRLALWATPL
ncbi:Hypothetical predicted protein [Octopus vulgaris]|uniref:Uncharacterized protein n=1 Tax=Octopus vulgaris TaxID=6645 RepID=A0AA36AQ90_OCTVU|nr:Hypothetical predicted protein [Octopus vulgaris]